MKRNKADIWIGGLGLWALSFVSFRSQKYTILDMIFLNY